MAEPRPHRGTPAGCSALSAQLGRRDRSPSSRRHTRLRTLARRRARGGQARAGDTALARRRRAHPPRRESAHARGQEAATRRAHAAVGASVIAVDLVRQRTRRGAGHRGCARIPGRTGRGRMDSRLATSRPDAKPDARGLTRLKVPGLNDRIIRTHYLGIHHLEESMSFRSCAALAAAALLALAGTAFAQQPIVIKFSHVVALDTPKGKGAEYFKKLAEERTKGRVKVEVYPNSQLFKDGEEMEALQLGSVQMLAPSVAKFGPLGVREFEVFDLPYIFDTFAELHKVTEGNVGKLLFQKLESKGVTGLAFWDNGFKDFSANRSIKLPSDYKGLKMRIQSSKVLGDEIKALGAAPQVMAFAEVYQALQTGVVGGTENPPSNFYTQKMHEVQKYLTLSEHGVIEYAVIVNKKFWDGLPADIRTELESAMKDATKYANDIAKKENDDALEAVRKSGRTQIISLSPEQKAAMKKVLVSVHKENESRVGKEIIAEVYKATGFKP